MSERGAPATGAGVPTAGGTRRPASRGCCTSTSTSSSPRSRSCAGPSSRGCRWSSAAGATRPSAAWCRPRRTRPGSSASAPACRCGWPLRKCPDAVFLPVDGPAYDAASARGDGDAAVAGVGRGPGGGRGARLGRGVPRRPGAGPRRPRRPARVRRAEIQAEVLAATRLHCSVGIGDNKLRAKIATDFGKPRGIWQLTEDNWFEVMGDRPTDALWGIGSQDRRRSWRRSASTPSPSSPPPTPGCWPSEIGPTMGPWYHRLGRGVDTSPVDATPWVPRAHGREETFQRTSTTGPTVERGGARADRPGGRGHRPRGPAGGAGRDQGRLPAVHHGQPQPDPARADQRPRRAGRRRGLAAGPGRAGPAGAAARRTAGDGPSRRAATEP